MEFNIGDKVVCVDAGDKVFLTQDKVYKVLEFLKYNKIKIISDRNAYGSYSETRFVSIQGKRNDVIDKILDL